MLLLIFSLLIQPLHFGELTGHILQYRSDRWAIAVGIVVHDAQHRSVQGVAVKGRWIETGLQYHCVTTYGPVSKCSVELWNATQLQITFVADTLNKPGYVYDRTANHLTMYTHHRLQP